jgi:hypothetical protein
MNRYLLHPRALAFGLVLALGCHSSAEEAASEPPAPPPASEAPSAASADSPAAPAPPQAGASIGTLTFDPTTLDCAVVTAAQVAEIVDVERVTQGPVERSPKGVTCRYVWPAEGKEQSIWFGAERDDEKLNRETAAGYERDGLTKLQIEGGLVGYWFRGNLRVFTSPTTRLSCAARGSLFKVSEQKEALKAHCQKLLGLAVQTLGAR